MQRCIVSGELQGKISRPQQSATGRHNEIGMKRLVKAAGVDSERNNRLATSGFLTISSVSQSTTSGPISAGSFMC